MEREAIHEMCVRLEEYIRAHNWTPTSRRQRQDYEELLTYPGRLVAEFDRLHLAAEQGESENSRG